MEAKTFLQDWHRLCECHDSCSSCPLIAICGSVNFFVPYNEHDIDKMIDIVSEWSVDGSQRESENMKMTIEHVIHLIHPDTSWKEQAKIMFTGGTEEDVKKAVEKACLMACEALEKQIPKKPVMYGEDSLLCPLCDCFIGYASEARGDDVYQDKFSHCSYCGQAIDWSE